MRPPIFPTWDPHNHNQAINSGHQNLYNLPKQPTNKSSSCTFLVFPRIQTPQMRRPLKPSRRIGQPLIRTHLPKLLPVIKHRPEIGDLGGDAPAAVSMNRGHLPEVGTVLTEAAEVQRVKESDSEAKLADDSAMDELQKNILLFLSRGIVLQIVPVFEEGNGSVVRSDKVESGVYEVLFPPWVAGEPVGADLEVLGFVWA